jgi:hypothetical protein
MKNDAPNGLRPDYGPAVLSKNIDVLRKLAKQRGRPLKRFWHTNADVARSATDWKATTPSPDAFTKGISFKHQGYEFDVEVNDEFVAVYMKWPGERGFVFSVNRRDRVMLTESTSTYFGPNKTLQLFTGSAGKDEERALAADSAIAAAVRRLNLAPKESLHGACNGLMLFLKPDRPEAVSDRVEALCELAALLPSAGTKEPAVELPAEFQELLPLVRRWAVTDDEKRSERLTRASPSARKQLVEKVGPHFDRINNYLDSFGEQPLSDGAILLGALAECATEAMLMYDLTGRKKRD